MSDPKITERMVEEGARWFAGMRQVLDGPEPEVTAEDRAYSLSFLESALGYGEEYERSVLQHPDVQAAFADEETRHSLDAFVSSLNNFRPGGETKEPQ